MGKLTVVLDRIDNLIDSDGLGKSDPYVKFELEQNNMVFDKNYGKKESTHKRNDCNPKYNETFEWDDIPSLNNMVLWIKVMDDDIGRDDVIGKGEVNLEHMGISTNPKDVEVVVDKKKAKGNICSPCKWLCACCFSCLCSRSAVVHLKISYTD